MPLHCGGAALAEGRARCRNPVEDEMNNKTTDKAAPTKKPLQLARETIRSLNVKTKLRAGEFPESPGCPSSHDIFQIP